MGKVTLQTVADAVGVSRMTVSNAFSRPDQLSASLRERILRAARDLGYAGPDPSARALARGSTGAVGVVLTDSLAYPFTDEVAMSFLGAIARELKPTGLALTLLSGVETEDRVPARDVPMDGALVYSCDPRSAAVEWLSKRGVPMVFVDQAPAAGIPSVNVDDRGGARAAAQHLVDLGHRRIGLVVSVAVGPYGVVDEPLDDPLGHAVRQRLLGWLDVLTAEGISPLVVRVPLNDHAAFSQAARTLLEAKERPTGVLCFFRRCRPGCGAHRPGPRPSGAARPVGRGVRRQPRRRACQARPDDRAAGLRREGQGCSHSPHGGPVGHRAEAGTTPGTAHHAGGARQQRLATCGLTGRRTRLGRRRTPAGGRRRYSGDHAARRPLRGHWVR